MTLLHRSALALLGLALTASAACAQEEPGIYARLETNRGAMVIKLFYEQTPITCANFVGLIEGSIEWKTPDGELVKRPFYDGLTFHRVIDGFMIQGGCPEGTGMGGPGYKFADEIVPELKHTGKGILSMANAGPGTNGSQFFVTLGPTPHLNGRHTVFGELVEGMDVLDAIGKTKTGPRDKPVETVTITKATVVRIGEQAEAFDAAEVFANRNKKVVPEAAGELDPSKVPQAGQAETAQIDARLICIQYKGCQRAKPEVPYTKEEALALAQKMVAHCRAKDADMEALARRWSDIPSRIFRLVKAQNDPSMAPAFLLAPGQVSDAVVTPYGVMIFARLP